MSLKEKTAAGIFWGGISNILQQALNLLFGIILARTLNAEDYGLVGMLAVFIAISGSIIDSGFVNALINKKEVSHNDYNAVFWFSCFAGLSLYFILFLLSPYIADFFGNEKLIDLSRVLFLCIIIGGLAIVHNAILLKEMRLKEKAKIEIISLLVAGTCGVCCAFSGLAYWSLVIQSVVSSFFQTILRWYYIKWRPSFSFDFMPVKRMFGFSSKILITNIFQHTSNNIISIILGRFYNERQVGLYSQGQKWMSMGHTFIGTIIQNVAQPVLVQVADDLDRQKLVFRKILRFGAFISFPLMLGLAFVGEEFILFVIGEKWLEAVPFLQIFCLWGAFAYVWTLYSSLLMSLGRSDLFLYGVVSTGVIQIIVVLIMRSFGIFPMIAAYLSIYFLTLIVWSKFVCNALKIKYIELAKDIVPFLLITVIAMFITWLITNPITSIPILLFSKILLVACLYLLILWKRDAVVLKDSVTFLRRHFNI